MTINLLFAATVFSGRRIGNSTIRQSMLHRVRHNKYLFRQSHSFNQTTDVWTQSARIHRFNAVINPIRTSRRETILSPSLFHHFHIHQVSRHSPTMNAMWFALSLRVVSVTSCWSYLMVVADAKMFTVREHRAHSLARPLSLSTDWLRSPASDVLPLRIQFSAVHFYFEQYFCCFFFCFVRSLRLCLFAGMR